MTTSILARALAGVAALATLGGTAFAQAPATPAAAAPIPVSGPVIPNVCVFSREALVQSSTVGKYVLQRMQTMANQARAELAPEQTALDNEQKALVAQRASLTPDAFNQRVTTLRQHGAALDEKAQIASRELEMTQDKAFGRINTEARPVLAQIYTSKNCGLLLDGNAVLAANRQMDITAPVVAALNTKITQFPFEREHLPASTTQAPAPAAPTRK